MRSFGERHGQGTVEGSVWQILGQAERRLRHSRRLNVFLTFLPSVTVGVLPLFSPSSLPLALPAFFVLLLLLGVFFAPSGRKKSDEPPRVIDRIIVGKERFLTLATLPDLQLRDPLASYLMMDALRKARGFSPSRDLPFTLDRRVIYSGACSLLCAVFVVLCSRLFLVGGVQVPSWPTEVESLRKAARSLLAQRSVEAKKKGQKFLLLEEKLRDPSLSHQKRSRLVEKMQMLVRVPLPNLLSVQMPMVGGQGGETGEGEGEEDQKSSEGEKSPGELHRQPSSTAPGGEGEGRKQPRPGEGGEESGARGTGEGQSQQQAGSEELSGRRGESHGHDDQSSGMTGEEGLTGEGQDPRPKDGMLPRKEKAGAGPSSGIGSGPGERYHQEGEAQEFLSEDSRFVKVRVPLLQKEEGQRVPNLEKAVLATPYSNAPLSEEETLDHMGEKQPIPLEYRETLQQKGHDRERRK